MLPVWHGCWRKYIEGGFLVLQRWRWVGTWYSTMYYCSVLCSLVSTDLGLTSRECVRHEINLIVSVKIFPSQLPRLSDRRFSFLLQAPFFLFWLFFPNWYTCASRVFCFVGSFFYLVFSYFYLVTHTIFYLSATWAASFRLRAQLGRVNGLDMLLLNHGD